jgi:hypothetical protein
MSSKSRRRYPFESSPTRFQAMPPRESAVESSSARARVAEKHARKYATTSSTHCPGYCVIASGR